MSTTSLVTTENSILSDDLAIGEHLGDKVVVSDLFLKTIRGELITLIGKYNQITMYENMFSPAISGNISIKDTEGLLEKHAITGGEEIIMKISKPNTNDIIIWRQDLVVHKISKSSVDNNLNTTYLLHFTTKSFINSIKRRLFKTFKNQTFTEAVKSIYTEVSSNEVLLETSAQAFKDPFVCPGLTPYKAIEYIAKRSCSKTNFYVFFERVSPFTGSKDGKAFAAPHYFGSVQKLMRDSDPNREFTIIFQPKTAGFREPNYGPTTIRTPKFTRSSNFNHLDVMLTGFYNSKITTIDPITRTFNLEKFGQANKSVETDFYKNNPLSKNVIFSQYDDLKHELPGERLVVSQYNDPYGKEKWLSNNIQGQILMNLLKIEVLVEGGTNTLGTGDIVSFKVPSHYKKTLAPSSSRIEDDIMYSGRYMITAAKHVIVGDNYAKQLELSRGSINLDINSQLQTVASTATKEISTVVNKNPDDKSYALRADGTLSVVILAASKTNTIKLLGNTLSITRNSSGVLSTNSSSLLTRLGIVIKDTKFLQDKSIKVLVQSIKKNEFASIMEAVVYTYPSSLNLLTEAVYLQIKAAIEAKL